MRPDLADIRAHAGNTIAKCTEHLKVSTQPTIILYIDQVASEDEWRTLFRAAAEHAHVRVLAVRYYASPNGCKDQLPMGQLVYDCARESRSLVWIHLSSHELLRGTEHQYERSFVAPPGMLAAITWQSRFMDHGTTAIMLDAFPTSPLTQPFSITDDLSVPNLYAKACRAMGIDPGTPALPTGLAYDLLNRLLQYTDLQEDLLHAYRWELAMRARWCMAPHGTYLMAHLRSEYVTKHAFRSAALDGSNHDHVAGAIKRIHCDTQGPWLRAEPKPEDERWYRTGNGSVVRASACIALNSRVLREMAVATSDTDGDKAIASLGLTESDPIPVPMVEDAAALFRLEGMCTVDSALSVLATATALGMDIAAYTATGAVAAYNTAFGIVSQRAAPMEDTDPKPRAGSVGWVGDQ